MHYPAKRLHAAYVVKGFFLPPFWDIFTQQKRLRKPFKEC